MIKVPTETFAFYKYLQLLYSQFFSFVKFKTHEIYCSVLVVLVVFFWSKFFTQSLFLLNYILTDILEMKKWFENIVDCYITFITQNVIR